MQGEKLDSHFHGNDAEVGDDLDIPAEAIDSMLVDAGSVTGNVKKAISDLNEHGQDIEILAQIHNALEAAGIDLSKVSNKEARAALEGMSQDMPAIDYKPMDGLSDDQRDIETRFAQRLAMPDAMDEYAKLPGTLNGKILNVDDMRELSPEYASGPEGRTVYTAATQGPASAKVKSEFKRRLKDEGDGPVMFLAGGGGSGKGRVRKTFLTDESDVADIILDGTFSKEKRAIEQIEAALTSNRPVEIDYIHRPLDDAAKGVEHRFNGSGRPVPPDVLAEAHINAQETILHLADKYKDNPDVTIRIFDNSAKEPVERNIEFLQKKRYTKDGESAQDAIKRLEPEVKRTLKNVTRQVKEKTDAAGKLADSRAARSVDGLNESGIQQEGNRRNSPGATEDGARGSQQPGLQGQRLSQTDTPAFKKWSGGAPVVKASEAANYDFQTGKPVVAEAYHGTNQPIKEFSEERQGDSTKAQSAGQAFFLS